MKLRLVAISSFVGTAWGSAVISMSVVAGIVGCDSPRTAPRGADNLELHTGRLRQTNPLEIAVLPVQSSTGKENVPLDALRQAFHRGLVRQRYTPLALAYVDTKIVEAAYTPGESNENAILQVFVSRWDDSRWKSGAELRVDGEIYLLDVAHPDPTKALWGGKFSRNVTMLARRQVVATDGELLNEAVQQFADDVLASLPSRNPEQVQ